jgi:hypothetical protein
MVGADVDYVMCRIFLFLGHYSMDMHVSPPDSHRINAVKFLISPINYMKIIFLSLVIVALTVTGCVDTPDHNGISNGTGSIKQTPQP